MILKSNKRIFSRIGMLVLFSFFSVFSISAESCMKESGYVQLLASNYDKSYEEVTASSTPPNTEGYSITLAVTEGKMYFTRMKVDGTKTMKSGKEVSYTFQVESPDRFEVDFTDFISDVPNPVAFMGDQMVEVPTARYTNYTIEFEPGTSSSAIAQQYYFYSTGTITASGYGYYYTGPYKMYFNNGGQKYAFTIAKGYGDVVFTYDTPTVDAVPQDPFVNRIVLNFPPSQWYANMPAIFPQIESDGTVVISDTVNQAYLTTFLTNFQASAYAFNDNEPVGNPDGAPDGSWVENAK